MDTFRALRKASERGFGRLSRPAKGVRLLVLLDFSRIMVFRAFGSVEDLSRIMVFRALGSVRARVRFQHAMHPFIGAQIKPRHALRHALGML